MCDHRFYFEDEIDKAVKEYFSSMLRNGWFETFNFWKIHLQKWDGGVNTLNTPKIW